MEIKKFIAEFIEALDDDSITNVTENTNFRELEAWDSLVALSIMALIDENYDVYLTAEEMKSATTIGELYNMIESKK